MTDHFRHIYQHDAERYDRLVSREDQHGNLFDLLMQLLPAGETIVEMGAGTGRLTLMLTFVASQVLACDQSPYMLAVAETKLQQSGMTNWQLAVADNRRLPFEDDIAGAVIEGWSFGHAMSWHRDDWQNQVDAMLDEMKRVARPDATLVIIETLGTNTRQPQVPSAELAQLYDWLESAHGFERHWVRTDYQFADVGEAVDLIRFFFGEDMAQAVAAAGRPVVSECTGIWVRRLQS